MNIADLRRDYSHTALLEADAKADPFEQFRDWLGQAMESQLPEPNAMTLATYDTQTGYPDARVVLLKGLDTGFVFYTNYQSHKAAALEAHPRAALNFVWLELERQVRIQGVVEKVSREESEAYFWSRPRGSQIGAWVSPQSQVIENREFLEQRQRELEAQYGETEKIPLPSHWGGYRLFPEVMEFWQGRSSRLHDRLHYSRQANGDWLRVRLAP